MYFTHLLCFVSLLLHYCCRYHHVGETAPGSGYPACLDLPTPALLSFGQSPSKGSSDGDDDGDDDDGSDDKDDVGDDLGRDYNRRPTTHLCCC